MDRKGSEELEQEIIDQRVRVEEFFREIEKVIVGQRYLVERILLGLLANGHILIEGLPGLAKTLAVQTFARAVKLKFSRIQFTPDMLPADLTGSSIYDQKTGAFQVRKGPVFCNIVLADEINRAPAKVQSALLEAMQERQVTVGESTLSLEQPFLVLATQNSIEQDGTYPLPESQLDRFMLKVRVSYPTRKEESLILKRMSYTRTDLDVLPVCDPGQILRLRSLVDRIYLDQKVEDYLLDIVEATRTPERFALPDLRGFIQYGVSPRAALHLSLASKALALIRGRSYVRPQDIKEVGQDVLCHRLIESYQARAQNVTAEEIVRQILGRVEMP